LAFFGIFSTSEWWFWEVCSLIISTEGTKLLAANAIAVTIAPLFYMFS